MKELRRHRLPSYQPALKILTALSEVICVANEEKSSKSIEQALVSEAAEGSHNQVGGSINDHDLRSFIDGTGSL